MKQFSYVLTNPALTHARPGGSLMREFSRFSSSVRLTNGERSAEARKPQDVLDLNIRSGDRITVTIEGRDEEAAIAAIRNYFVVNM